MGKSLYLLKSGRLYRKENTLWFEGEGFKKVIPLNAVSEIEVFGEIEINKRVLELLSQEGIPVHFYNHYGYYAGTYYPRESLNSGFVLVKQVEHYIDYPKRMFIAKKFLEGATYNLIKNLKTRGDGKCEVVSEIESLSKQIEEAESIEELMAVEGNIRNLYYWGLSKITGMEFGKRTKRPPENELNALISFGNSLIYTQTLSEIYKTHLDPRIGYLHQSNTRSFSLNLDIAEIFKPLIVDRVIIYLINRKVLKEEDFEREIGLCYLSESGKRKFLKAYEEKLNATIKHRKLKRKVSHGRLIRLECYKLLKHLIGDEVYTPLKAWW
ncbi:type I-B CRISPR-associated endonuclease Cas1b [Thermovibrio sp.]